MTPPLTNIDSIRANHPTFWTDLKNGTYLKLAPRIAVRRDHYHCLDFPFQLRLRAIAAARSAYTAVLISKSAARVHGLWVIATAEEKIEMALPTNTLPHKDRRHPERIYRKASLPEPVLVDGTRCVSKARAVIDVARYHGFTDGLIAADSALRSGLSREDLKKEFARMGRVRNSRIVRAVIHHTSPLSRSPYESFARALLIEADFPWPMFFEAPFTALPGITTALCINSAYLIDIIPAKALPHQRERHRRLREAGFTVLLLYPATAHRPPHSLPDRPHFHHLRQTRGRPFCLSPRFLPPAILYPAALRAHQRCFRRGVGCAGEREGRVMANALQENPPRLRPQ